MSQNSSLKQTGSNYGQNVVCSDNPGQSISHKVKKSSKIGQDFTNLLSDFVFFDSDCQFNFWKEDWALGCVSTQI